MAKLVLYVTNPKVEDMFLIPSIINENSDQVIVVTSKVEVQEKLTNNDIDLIICDRATFLLTKEQINLVEGNCFNIHPSFLPHNRGYHPNFWSAYDQTPSGVTIHNIDPNIDSGKIVAQTRIHFKDRETLRTSYYKLRELSVSLFKSIYPCISEGLCLESLIDNPSNIGRTNYKADFEGVYESLPKGWDTTIAEVQSLALKVNFKRKED